MKDLALAGRSLLTDLASTILFMGLYALTGSVEISVVAGVALVLAQLGWKFARHQRPDALQWISLVLVLAAGGATLAAHNPIFVMLKPSAIYVLVGCAMLQKGWMVRYMPAPALEYLPDLVVAFGYVWAALMFFSAILNLVLAANCSVIAWGAAMAVWGTASKAAMILAQYGVMKFIGRRRYRARMGMMPKIAASTIA